MTLIKSRRLALAHVQVPPETLDEVSRALLAAALDPDGGSSDLQGLLAAVDRSLAKRGSGPPAGSVSQVVNAGSLSGRGGPPAEKAWPFPRSNLPKGTRLPQGYTIGMAGAATEGQPAAMS